MAIDLHHPQLLRVVCILFVFVEFSRRRSRRHLRRLPVRNPPQWKALSAKKLQYDAHHLFDVDNLVFAGIGAGFDQLRDRPGQWGGWGVFAGRYGSHVGQYLIQRSIMFPVQAVDHEDTRFFPSTRKSYAGRIGDAFLHTVWRHDDAGEMMPAYSEFLGDYGAAAVSRLWWPSSIIAGAIFIAGSG